MTTRQMVTVQTKNGPLQLTVPNQVVDAGDFYVSYNDYDTRSYGSVTTALVQGQMEKFFILKGDHRAQYQDLIPQGFEACLAYYKSQAQDIHPYSDKLPT